MLTDSEFDVKPYFMSHKKFHSISHFAALCSLLAYIQQVSLI